MKIGILGGSFDPAHKGHLAISKEAKKRFKLKKIIWAITKKNPLKAVSKTPISKRIDSVSVMLTPIFKNAFEEARGATSILVSSYNSKSLEIAVPIDPPAAISNQTWLKYALEKHKTPAENVTILTLRHIS